MALSHVIYSWVPRRAQKGPFGPKQTLELLSAPEEADLVPNYVFSLAEWPSCANFDRSHDRSATILNFSPISALLGPKRNI